MARPEAVFDDARWSQVEQDVSLTPASRIARARQYLAETFKPFGVFEWGFIDPESLIEYLAEPYNYMVLTTSHWRKVEEWNSRIGQPYQFHDSGGSIMFGDSVICFRPLDYATRRLADGERAHMDRYRATIKAKTRAASTARMPIYTEGEVRLARPLQEVGGETVVKLGSDQEPTE